jgi:hypothetical protein
MRPDHRRVETAARRGLSDYPVTPSEEPGSADEAVIGLEPVGSAAPELIAWQLDPCGPWKSRRGVH